MSFVHLHVHTEFSISDSIIRVDALADKVREFGMPAVGVADLAHIYSAVKVYKACIERGVKPVIGVEALIANHDSPELQPFSLVLLCQNTEGYRAMCGLLTRAQHERRGADGGPCIERQWLEGRTDGLIALSGGKRGEIGQMLLHRRMDDASRLLKQYQQLFPDRFYVELTRVGDDEGGVYDISAIELADHAKVPVVATNEPRFISAHEHDAHEIRVCINEQAVVTDRNRPRSHTDQQYLRSADEMRERFSDIPCAADNTLEIAKRCNLSFDLQQTHLPAYPNAKKEDIDSVLAQNSRDGLERIFPDGVSEEYVERLEHELEIIRKTQFAGYFLIVADIIKWSKSENIPVGPGRGSGAGSLVAYCLGITDIDPIPHQLIFERFLNPERVSPPDFDIDFCVRGRDRVIQHVSDTYGKDKVAQIVTYQTLAARAAIRDVGRATRPDYMYYDQLARLIPIELDITLDQALQKNAELKQRYEKEPRVRDLIDSAKILEGIVRNVGKHPGGVVIAPEKINHFSASFADSDGELDITDFDKDDLEAIGLVKFDFLGLTTLTVIAHAFEMINAGRRGEPPLSTQDIKLDDEATYRYIQTGRTIGVFQLESPGMQRLIVDSKPKTFDELVALLALFRPGPLQSKMDRTYISNKDGSTKIEYLDPVLEDVLASTYGVILYQEQVMQIAQVMAGYTLGEADLLRRAMGKKLASEMANQRKRFTGGAVGNGYDRDVARQVYDQIEKFAGYGFNKSHSVAYALLAFQTAWLKSHYAAYLFASSLSVDFKSDNPLKVFSDIRAHGIEVFGPDVNRSGHDFQAIDSKTMLYGFCGLKQIGKPVAQSIMETREKDGEFASVEDFVQRMDPSKIGKQAIEALAASGSFDSIEPNRARIFNNAESLCGQARQIKEDREAGQLAMFGGEGDASMRPIDLPEAPQWSNAERLEREKFVFGYYFDGHPAQRDVQDLRVKCSGDISGASSRTGGRVTLCGWVENLQVIQTSRNQPLAFFELKDETGDISVTVYSEVYAGRKEALAVDGVLAVHGKLETDAGKIKLIADDLIGYDEICADPDACLVVRIESGHDDLQKIQSVKDIIADFSSSRQRVFMDFRSVDGDEAKFALGDSCRVSISRELLHALRNAVGEEMVAVKYFNKASLPFRDVEKRHSGRYHP